MKNPFSKLLKRLAVVPMAITMAVSSTVGVITSFADESVNQNVKTAQNGVYAIKLEYVDKNTGKSFDISSGTCFFINNDTLVTCDHVVTLTDAEEAAVSQKAKAEYGSYNKNNLAVQVMVQWDFFRKAEIVEHSSNTDWAVLRLRESLNVEPLKIGNSDQAENTQTVYAIGFPEVVQNYTTVKNFSRSDITTTKGQISKVTSINGIDYIQHSATVAEGNSGGPLVDDNGAVIGVNSMRSINQSDGTKEDYYHAISMEQIIEILSKINIDYTRSSANSAPVEESQPEVTDPPVESKPEEVTSTSEPAVTTPVDESKPEVTAPSVLSQAEDSSSAESGGLDTKMIILIAAGAIVLILVIVIIIVMAGGKKPPKQVGGYSSNQGNNPQQMRQQPMPPQQMQPQQMQQMRNQQQNTVVNNAGETTVLGGGAAGETTVLGSAAAMFSMVRKKNGETFGINKASFVMGKDTSADYCVSGNSSVSRNHAKLLVKGTQCFITDMRSTNGTFVNGARVAPNQEVPLKNGDIIRLSDEEFEFRG